jgi:RHS repeat-associated protein
MSVSGQSQISYGFDNASRLTSITQGSASVSFGYDNDGRRVSLVLPNSITANYAYDAASELEQILYQGGSLTPANLVYSYDLAGRRIGISGTLASTQLPSAVSSASYNANNQLTQWGSTTMSYDLNGSTLNDGTNSYSWDARNRLISADSGGAAFAYDPLGRRTEKTLLGTNTSFLYDGANPVQELNGSTVTANLLTGGIDERFLRSTSSEMDNFLTDALGSTIELTGSTGNETVQYSYAPFGAVSISGSTTSSYTYTGREFDGLGIDYFRARYYNPTSGRFLSEDPIGFLGGINVYAFVGDDPIDFGDPSGLDRKSRKIRQQIFADAEAEALKLLENPKCAQAFNGQGADRIHATHYIARPQNTYTLAIGTWGMVTTGPYQVTVNSQGSFYNWDPGTSFQLPYGAQYVPPSAVLLGAFELLHELTHQFGIGVDDGDDNPLGQQANNEYVYENCFQN